MTWLDERGHDVRAWDRGDERSVWGPTHTFNRPSDLMLTNGLVRLTCGPRGARPYVSVEAFRNGSWRQVGALGLGRQGGSEAIKSARLVRLTPDEGTMAISSHPFGDVYLTLKRGERMIRVLHGSGRHVYASNRYVRWLGAPPADTLSGATTAAGKFGDGLDLNEGEAKYKWPMSKKAWSVALWWSPDLISTAQLASALWSAYDSASAMTALIDFNTTRLRFQVGSQLIQSSILSFAALEPIFVRASFSTAHGMAMTVKPNLTGVQHVSGPSTDTGTSKENYDHFRAAMAADPREYGSGSFGTGNFGGWAYANGVIDNLMLFDRFLTDAEADALSGATSALGGLPSPVGDLVWYAPYDARLEPIGSAMTSGRRSEVTTSGGSTRRSENGLTKALAAVDNDVLAAETFGMGLAGSSVSIAAYLATTDPNDDLADHHQQFAAESEQQLRVR